MAKPHTITSLPASPEADRHRRMIEYSIAMSIRVVCLLLCFVVQGWWLVIPVIGAIILPYVAVVLANASSRRTNEVERPGAIEVYRSGNDQ